MEIFNNIKAWLNDKITWIVTVLVLMLPTSPFEFFTAPAEYSEWFGVLNWFIPVGTFVSILELWLVAVAGWYALSAFLRWAKVTE